VAPWVKYSPKTLMKSDVAWRISKGKKLPSQVRQSVRKKFRNPVF
jgi:hypothetical protein